MKFIEIQNLPGCYLDHMRIYRNTKFARLLFRLYESMKKNFNILKAILLCSNSSKRKEMLALLCILDHVQI